VKDYDLVIVGDINGDIMLTDADPRPVFGQAEKFMQDGLVDLGGGSAITASQACKLGLRTAFIGKVGDDLLGRLLIDKLTACGVDTRGIAVDPSIGTGFTVHLCSSDDRAMLTYAGSIAQLHAEDAPLDLIARARHLHVSDFFLQPGLQAGLPALFQQVRGLGIGISFETAWDPTGGWGGTLPDVLPLVDIILPNEQELKHITRRPTLDEALEALACIVPTVVTKVGARGAVALHRGQRYAEPAYPVEPAETTGAGDNFNAGFLYGYLHGLSMQSALRAGCACGALSMRALGGVRGQVTLAELHGLLPDLEEEKTND
jgi:sugar/nucleoside kinase (ribokinase family)